MDLYDCMHSLYWIGCPYNTLNILFIRLLIGSHSHRMNIELAHVLFVRVLYCLSDPSNDLKSFMNTCIYLYERIASKMTSHKR